MSAVFERQRGRAVTWRTILGLLLIPLTAAGLLLWGLWNPTERLETVTAAVVNLDEPVTVDGQTVPLGRVLAAELIGSPRSTAESSDDADDEDAPVNFTWVLTDEEDAAAGLGDGRYATVVTIPENFSNAATSFSRAAAGSQSGGSSNDENADDGADDPETAVIDVETSDRGRLLDSALSGIVTSTATSVLNKQLGSQFVGGVFVGMTELGSGIGEAADGAKQLASGSTQLADGVAQLADGGSQLADGAEELATGTAQLSSGVQQLAGGTGELASGMTEYASGMTGFAAGAHVLATGDGKENPGLVGLSGQLGTYVGGVNQALTGLQYGASEAIAPLTQLRDAIEAGILPADDPVQAVEQLNLLIGQLETMASQDPESPVQALISGGPQLAGGFSAMAGGAQELASGADRLSGAANQLAGGVNELSSGMGQLADQVPQLAVGTSELASGARQSADGTAQLADGARQAADGTTELASGLSEAADGIPNYSESQSERLAEVAVQPVEAQGASDELFNASGVPLFVGIALWAGAFASFLVLAPLWRRTREAARGVGYLTFRSALPAIGLGAAQGAIAGLVLPALLGYDLVQGLGFFGLAVLAGVAFSLVNQGLTALLGGFGSFLSFALLVVAFAIGVISTAPAPLQAIGDASPIGALFDGFQAIALGTSGGPAAVFSLVLWALGGLLLTAWSVARERRRIVP